MPLNKSSLLLVFGLVLWLVRPSFASWTPLITSSDFTGISGDVNTASAGILSVLLVILGVGLLARIFMR